MLKVNLVRANGAPALQDMTPDMLPSEEVFVSQGRQVSSLSRHVRNSKPAWFWAPLLLRSCVSRWKLCTPWSAGNRPRLHLRLFQGQSRHRKMRVTSHHLHAITHLSTRSKRRAHQHLLLRAQHPPHPHLRPPYSTAWMPSSASAS